jgi:lipoic acid synthetase
MKKLPIIDDSTPPRPRLPRWFKVEAKTGPRYLAMRELVAAQALHTVCEEARCPNIWDCWNRGTATFMILGDICTRSCGFCAVKGGRPEALDLDEPRRVGEAVHALALRHAVITSVNRDELADGGAAVFAETIRQVRCARPACTIEVLIPDFEGDTAALACVFAARPDILNHNLETVPRLYPRARPQAKYGRSLDVLRAAKAAGLVAKTGIMVGLGELRDEVETLMRDVAATGCEILTIGQYLQPTPRHLPVARFYPPDEFADLKRAGLALGLKHVESGPLVRSSYHAAEQADSLYGE